MSSVGLLSFRSPRDIAWIVCCAALTLASCGGSTSGLPTARSMPKGGTFHGVWQSPQYGEMHMCVNGVHAVAVYEKDGLVGKLQGKVAGNRVLFDWEDRRELVVGHERVRRGKGYFSLTVADDGDSYITGHWGYEKKFTDGGPWNAVRLRRGEPERCGKSEEASPAAPKSSNSDPLDGDIVNSVKDWEL